jgi:hypothetical protein
MMGELEKIEAKEQKLVDHIVRIDTENQVLNE